MLQASFYLRPFFVRDGEPDAVAGGAVGHDVVVAEGAFVLGAICGWRLGTGCFRGGS